MTVLDGIQALVGPDKVTISWWQMGVRGLIVFVVGLGMMRIAGARTFTRGSPLETVVAVIIGSNLSRALAGNTPFWPMLGVSVLIVGLHGVLAHATLRSRTLAFLVKRPPVPLARDGRLDRKAMAREGVDSGDVDASLREHGLTELGEVALATLERDGKISVVKRDPKLTPGGAVRSSPAPGSPRGSA